MIGTGRIGLMHARLLASQVPGAALAAVSDAVGTLAEEVARSLVAPAMGTGAMMADPSVDAVAICSPTDTHADLVVAAAGAGKAIFCEKPVSLDLAEVDRAVAAAERAGVLLAVGFNRRFDPSHAQVRQAVAAGTVGAPHLARITSRDPAPPPLSYAAVSGGIFMDMTVHDFDMARFVVGSDVVAVHAAGAVRVEPELERLGDVDTAVVTLWHEDGCISVIDNSRQARYGYDQRVEVFGANGMAASTNPLAHNAFTLTAQGSTGALLPHFFIERYAASYLAQWTAFVAAAQGRPDAGGPALAGVRDARAALVLGLAAKRSLAEARAVRTDEVDPTAGGAR